MLTKTTNLGTLAPIHTDFGNNTGDLLVVEYDVPQTKVKQTLFYKYGQLSIPKWALIPAGILAFGLITALCAIILNSILSQSTSSITYSQSCSKTSKCKTDLGLTCGSQSKCVCSDTQYWYEDKCVGQPTYKKKCNQTTECRTDLGLICAEFEGQCNCPNTTIVQTCDCSSTSYWTGSTCTARSSNLGACSVADTSYQCINNLYCNGSMCVCASNTQYWNTTASECYSIDKYLDLCDPSTYYSCDISVSLSCLTAGEGSQCPFNVTANSTSCDCKNGTYWNGGSCVSKKTINIPCFWSCECDSTAGLQCLNMTCVCPKKNYWSTVSSPSLCKVQNNYTQSCSNTSECDTTQGLTCYLSGLPCNCPTNSSTGMCDCLRTQYYDSNLTSCQILHLYNETCIGSYMCDSSLGLFCQMNVSSATNCSCPEPIRLNMCDCNMTSYWDGIACVSRLEPNVSCSFEYQCQTNYTCIVNQTDIGIFSDACRCPLGSYYVNGSGCVASKNYTQSCDGSYQCSELIPLSCRTDDTSLTCLHEDASVSSFPACDCLDNYYFATTSNSCVPLLNRTGSCTKDCQCNQPYLCQSNQCQCEYYYSSINKTCVDNLSYGDQCSNSTECSATPNTFMSCVNGTCRCNSTGYWDGSQCQFTINFRAICTASNNCFGGLVCQNITCIGSNKRCACPNGAYFSSSTQICTPCNGSQSSYTKYVINYPNSDLCVGIRSPSSSYAFNTADSECSTLPAMASGTPQLLSVHNQSELNCIATVVRNSGGTNPCSNGNRFYYLGYNPTNFTFYDGTSYNSTFASPVIPTNRCLNYCYNNDNTGSFLSNGCSGTGGGKRYGTICNYRVL